MQSMKALAAGLTLERVAQLDERLRSRRTALVGTVASETAELNDPLSTALPPLEATGDREAASAGIRDVATSLSQAHRAELEAIDAALDRLRAGAYGLCDACGEPIGYERLAAQPDALRCVRCQSAAERGATHASL
jgi:DnaK suppressor protein